MLPICRAPLPCGRRVSKQGPVWLGSQRWLEDWRNWGLDKLCSQLSITGRWQWKPFLRAAECAFGQDIPHLVNTLWGYKGGYKEGRNPIIWRGSPDFWSFPLTDWLLRNLKWDSHTFVCFCCPAQGMLNPGATGLSVWPPEAGKAMRANAWFVRGKSKEDM